MIDNVFDQEDIWSVQGVSDKLFEALKSGLSVVCPVCKQHCKIYKRKLTSSMVLALIHIDRYFEDNPEEEWVHVENHLKDIKGLPAAIRGDFPKLRFWSFIKKKEDTRDDGSKRVGYYRITELGNAFVHNLIEAPKHAFIYNNELLHFSDEVTRVAEALGSKFDYNELMGIQDEEPTLF